jgi:hypothetical protein
MASLADLFNPTFFMFLGILVLASALIVVYFESKIRDQNHKIASMLSLVSTLAEDTNGIKLGLNHLAMTSFGGPNRQPFFQPPLEEENEEDEEDEEQKENNKEEKKEHKLISVSDDDDNSDSDSDSESNADDEESLLDSVSDSDSESNADEISDHNDIKVLKLNIANDLFDNNERTKDLEELEDLEDLEDLEVLEDSLSDTQSVELNSELLTAEEKNEDNLLTTDFKTININLEDSNNESIDYKKLSLTKLRSIVSEKGLSLDSSKLKKQDLLKLLGVE